MMSQRSKSSRLLATVVFASVGVLPLTVNGASPAYRELPEVTVTPLPALDARPSSLSKREAVPGVVIRVPEPYDDAHYRRQEQEGHRRVGLFSNTDDADAFEKNRIHERRDIPPTDGASVCFDVASEWNLKSDDHAWPERRGRFPVIYAAMRGSEAAKDRAEDAAVRAVRLEKLGLTKDAAAVNVTDFWLDPTTLGTRTFHQGSLKLDEVAKGPAGVRVFAGREEEDAGGELHFFVHRPYEADQRINRVISDHMTVLHGGMSRSSSDCAHVHVELVPSLGIGDQVSVELEVLLPDPSRDKAKPKREAAPPPPDGASFEEVKVRQLRVNLGVSRTTSDDEPVVTVSFRWAGPTQRKQVF